MAAADQTPGIRPAVTFGRRLDIAARCAFPAGCTALLMLLAGVPLGIVGQAALLPALSFASVYFWSLLRPAAMSQPLVFLVGLLFDLLGYLPLGVGPLTLLIVYGLVQRWRTWLMAQGVGAGWVVFILFASGAAAVSWILASMLSFRLLPPAPALLGPLLAAALYPVLAMLFLRAHRTVADPERA